MVSVSRSRCPSGSRRGLASLEAVMATAIVIPIVAFLFYSGLRACKNLTRVIEELVGWPFL
jgi:hypothetical protein